MLNCVFPKNGIVIGKYDEFHFVNTVWRFDGMESSCKGIVRFSILCTVILCVQFGESRYCVDRRVLTIVKNCST